MRANCLSWDCSWNRSGVRHNEDIRSCITKQKKSHTDVPQRNWSKAIESELIALDLNGKQRTPQTIISTTINWAIFVSSRGCFAFCWMTVWAMRSSWEAMELLSNRPSYNAKMSSSNALIESDFERRFLSRVIKSWLNTNETFCRFFYDIDLVLCEAQHRLSMNKCLLMFRQRVMSCFFAI